VWDLAGDYRLARSCLELHHNPSPRHCHVCSPGPGSLWSISARFSIYFYLHLLGSRHAFCLDMLSSRPASYACISTCLHLDMLPVLESRHAFDLDMPVRPYPRIHLYLDARARTRARTYRRSGKNDTGSRAGSV
jgi:hypothetical protein